MKLITDLEQKNLTKSPSVFTFGNFDGVHRGHQYIFSKVREEAKSRGLKTACLTFSNNPIELLWPNIRLQQLTSTEQKLQLLKSFDFDFLFFLPFDTAMRQLSAQDFLDKIQNVVPFSLMVVGQDVTFGHNGEGNSDFLKSHVQGFESMLLERFAIDGIPVSSSKIRQAIGRADFKEAEKLLGRPYVLLVHELSRYALPPEGLYRVLLRDTGEWKNAKAEVSSIQQIALIDYNGTPTELRFLEKE